MFGEPLTGQVPTLSENEMKRYSDLEVDLLIDAISEAALEAIEQAAGEAAKAAVLSMVEREAALLQAQTALQKDVEQLKSEMSLAKKAGFRNAIIAGLACFLGGLIFGVTGTIIISNQR